MKRWQKLVKLSLVGEAVTLWRLMWHRSVPLGAKVTVGLALSYVVMPLDFIPDMLPVLGWVDDAAILTGLVYLAYRMVPDEVMDELRGRKKVYAKVHAD